MNTYIYAYITNGMAIMILTLLISLSFRSMPRKSNSQKLFFVMIFVSLFQSVCFILSYAFEHYEYFNNLFLANAINSMLFVSNVCFALLFYYYTYSKMHPNAKSVILINLLFMIPLLFITVCAIINLFTPVLFRINTLDHYSYERLPLYYSTYGIVLFYIALAAFYALKNSKKADVRMFFPVFMFLIPILTCMLIEAILGVISSIDTSGVSLLMLGASVSLTVLYICSIKETSYTDPLSQLFSRQQLFISINHYKKSSDKGKLLAGVMLDLDNFKKINDSYGHVIGDEVIKVVGQIIHTSLNKFDMGFRYAGDEFIVLLFIDSPSELENYVKKLYSILKEYNTNVFTKFEISFSSGYTIYKRPEHSEKFIERMDSMMYEAKRLKKAK